MPFVAFAVAFLVLTGPLPMQPALAQSGASVLPIFDDEFYNDKDDSDDGAWADEDDRGFNLYDDEEDDEGSSAHGPHDDDDGWDIDELDRSERA